MSISYNWKITGLKVKDILNVQNAVIQTYWQKTGIDENGNEGTFSGATPFTADPLDSSGPFIPFEELTEENVLDWVKSVVVGQYEEHVNDQIQKQIDEKINPITEPVLPWVTDSNTSNTIV